MLQSVSKEKILITGGSGFLGSHLCRRFLHHGAEVHAVSRSKRNSDPAGLRWWQGDMADVGTVRRILYQIKPDVIFHLSGLATAVPDRELVLPTVAQSSGEHRQFISGGRGNSLPSGRIGRLTQ